MSSTQAVHAAAREASAAGLPVVDRLVSYVDRSLASSAVIGPGWLDHPPGLDLDADPASLARVLVAAPGAPSFSVITTA